MEDLLPTRRTSAIHIVCPPNPRYTPFPDPLGVRGNLGALTCAKKGEDYLVELNVRMMKEYVNASGLDWIVFWPYDEGGCGCSDDWPWGGKGFPRISSQVRLSVGFTLITLSRCVDSLRSLHSLHFLYSLHSPTHLPRISSQVRLSVGDVPNVSMQTSCECRNAIVNF
jgi:hypothetical protein